MKVLLVSPLPPPVGGIASWTVDYLNYCKENKADVDITLVDSAIKGSRAENVSQDVFDCIDIVSEKLLTQMSKYKGKLMKKQTSKESIKFEMIPEAVEPAEESKIVKTKKFPLTPMTVDDAVLQMEMLQHDFFVYMDMETNSVNVVYSRKNGDYGVLVTEE